MEGCVTEDEFSPFIQPTLPMFLLDSHGWLLVVEFGGERVLRKESRHLQNFEMPRFHGMDKLRTDGIVCSRNSGCLVAGLVAPQAACGLRVLAWPTFLAL